MAQTKNSKSTGKGKTRDREVAIADLHCDYMTENGATVALDLYDNGEKNDRVKLTIGDAFIIYCTAIVVNRKKDSYAFLSYPSFYSDKSDKYYNQAFCFEKSLIAEINEDLNSYYF